MKCNFKHLQAAISHVNYQASKEAEVEITERNEDIQNGTIMGCVILTVSYKKAPETYERDRTVKVVTTTVELFAQHENRNPVVTTTETYELLEK